MKYISRHALSPVDRNRAVTREGGRREKFFSSPSKNVLDIL